MNNDAGSGAALPPVLVLPVVLVVLLIVPVPVVPVLLVFASSSMYTRRLRSFVAQSLEDR